MSRAGIRVHGLEKLEVEVYFQDHFKNYEDGKEERNPAKGKPRAVTLTKEMMALTRVGR